MTLRKYLLALIFPILLVTVAGCDLLVELTNSKFHFIRNENLVGQNGAQYGSLSTVKKMHR